ncbi:hypothetical protein BH10CYA1_BH10CYA1_32640 [soil metagenome]
MTKPATLRCDCVFLADAVLLTDRFNNFETCVSYIVDVVQLR